MQSPLPITNTCVNILETQFALHINLQYKLSRRWRSMGERDICGTVVYLYCPMGVFLL